MDSNIYGMEVEVTTNLCVGICIPAVALLEVNSVEFCRAFLSLCSTMLERLDAKFVLCGLNKCRPLSFSAQCLVSRELASLDCVGRLALSLDSRVEYGLLFGCVVPAVPCLLYNQIFHAFPLSSFLSDIYFCL
jgi:hypothetical protein